MHLNIVLYVILVLVAAIVSVAAFIKYAPQFGGKATPSQYQRYATSPNFQNGRFVNQIETVVQNPDGSFGKTMREFLKRGQDRVPSVMLPFVKIDNSFFKQHDKSSLHVTWLGHSSVLIQWGEMTLLTDPMFGQRASPVSFMGPKRFNKELSCDPAAIPHLDAIILSHDHYDHLDYKTIKALHFKTDRFVVPLGVAPHLVRWGVAFEKITELDWWETTKLGELDFVATPARHFSGRGTDRASTLWISWVIKDEKTRLYFGGDSGYGPHFKEIGDVYGPFDLTMLENGAYNEAWPFVHMMPEQTAQAHRDLRGKVLLPIHWAQFNLSLHPWREPIERLSVAAQKADIQCATPRIGERFSIESPPQSNWWKNL